MSYALNTELPFVKPLPKKKESDYEKKKSKDKPLAGIVEKQAFEDSKYGHRRKITPLEPMKPKYVKEQKTKPAEQVKEVKNILQKSRYGNRETIRGKYTGLTPKDLVTEYNYNPPYVQQLRGGYLGGRKELETKYGVQQKI